MLFQTAILVKWSPPPAPKLKLIQTLPECSPICPLSPQVAQISTNVPGPYRRLSKKPWFFRYFIFFSTKKRFYSIQISYLESAHKTTSNDVWFVSFSNKKLFLQKIRARVPLRDFSLKNSFFGFHFFFISNYFWRVETRISVEKLRF